jgi:hypothetical protein
VDSRNGPWVRLFGIMKLPPPSPAEAKVEFSDWVRKMDCDTIAGHWSFGLDAECLGSAWN